MKKRITTTLLAILVCACMALGFTACGGNKKIDTVKELQEALYNGGDVTLGGSIDVGSKILVIPEKVTVNLDLAGYTLRGSDSYIINNRGTLKISGGTISCSGNDVICNFGVITLNGGTLTGSNRVILNNANAILTVNGGEIKNTKGCAVYNDGSITVNGGTISSLNGYAVNNIGDADINGGTLTGVECAVFTEGTLTVKGGAFSIANSPDANIIRMGSGTLKLSGDNFTFSETNTPISLMATLVCIDLTEYAGESLKILSPMTVSLSAITLPKGWGVYDENGNELTEPAKWNIAVVKPSEVQ